MKRMLAGAAIALLATSAAQAGTTWTTEGKGWVHGDNAYMTLDTVVRFPRGLRAQISANTEQNVDVSWVITCFRGDDYGSRSGDFSARTPILKSLPIPISSPDSCDVNVTTFGERDRLTTQIKAS